LHSSFTLVYARSLREKLSEGHATQGGANSTDWARGAGGAGARVAFQNGSFYWLVVVTDSQLAQYQSEVNQVLNSF
jgi:hypothetical protein